MLLPLWILAMLTMAVGVYSTFTGAGRAVRTGGRARAPAWLTPSAVGARVAGILLAWLTYQRRTINAGEPRGACSGRFARAALAKFWIDDVFEGVYDVVLLGFSRVVGLGRSLSSSTACSTWSARGRSSRATTSRTIQTGKAQDYVYGVAVGVLVLVLWMRLVFA